MAEKKMAKKENSQVELEEILGDIKTIVSAEKETLFKVSDYKTIKLKKENLINSGNKNHSSAVANINNKELEELVKKIVKKVTGNTAKLNCRGGTSDSRFLGSIPRLELGLRNNTIHMVDERSSISDLKKLTKIYYNILENYFK